MVCRYKLYWPLTLLGLMMTAPVGALSAAPKIAGIPPAIYTDPPHDARHPARMEVLHIPTGGVKINGIAYLAEGVGSHPTAVFLIGLPGNEKNLDLAQAVRRAGWNAISFFYRGSWGSPGVYRFSHCLQDTNAVLAYLRDKRNARALGVDTARIVLVGHSLGGWLAAETAAHDHRLAGVALISAADIGNFGATMPHAKFVRLMSGLMESLAHVTPEEMANEVEAHAALWRFARIYGQLDHVPLLVVTSDKTTEPGDDALVAALRARGDTRLTAMHMDTDHFYSDHRIALESVLIRWLQSLP
jgi:pimeloyl-ACP methyl ester carboxylesterase